MDFLSVWVGVFVGLITGFAACAFFTVGKIASVKAEYELEIAALKQAKVIKKVVKAKEKKGE